MNRAKSWSILVKPTNDCNLDCKYCYDKPMREKNKGKKMSFEMVDYILKMATDHAEYVSWIWHGGEPTMMGKEWFVKVQEIFYKYADKSYIVQNMQSNGLLIDEEWAQIFKDYKIDVGLSFDAFNQMDVRGDEKDITKDKINLLMDNNVNVGTITVINNHNYKRQIELYEYFKENFPFTPAFNHVYKSQGVLDNDLEPDAEDYAQEFLKYFNHWIYDNSKKPLDERSVSLMMNFLSGKGEVVCSYTDCRKHWIGVNADGEVYPCDRYLPEKYSLGNIMDYENISEIFEHSAYKLYSMEIQKRLMTHCKKCGFYEECKGGCNANHVAATGSGVEVDNFTCDLFRKNFINVYKFLRDLDIYDENHKFSYLFLKHINETPFFTIKEIKELFDGYGISIDHILDKTDYEGLKNSAEFKLFRFFNQYKSPKLDGHNDFFNATLELNIVYGESFKMNQLKEKRFRSMEDLFSHYKKEILALINEGK